LLLLLAASLLHGAKPALAKERKATATAAPSARPEVARDGTLILAYLGQEAETTVARLYFEAEVTDQGIQGARLGVLDNNTTGRFMHQQFELKETKLAAGEDAESAFRRLVAEGRKYILVDLAAPMLERIADLPEAREVLVFDLGSRDDELRGEKCRRNVLHLMPSRAMRADALAQYFARKRWSKWFLVVGPAEADRRFAVALKRAAKRFGHKIVAERIWTHTFEDRRTPESEVPVFTQGIEYDVLVVADEAGLFGDYLPYRTWLPRPVAGTQALVAVAWHPTLETWGAIQLQNRFRALAGRAMTEVDYGGWLAVRAVGEAATRTGSLDFAAIRQYLSSESFALAGFKGVPLSFRPWDGQLRQPVLLATERSLVAVAPVEGFLHPKNELDTLGYDEPETQCHGRP
jgi:ABC transporter substrate binding protein (PQQ-dependent alcohol dehydrogenase system)